jgi:hypothetical protein
MSHVVIMRHHDGAREIMGTFERPELATRYAVEMAASIGRNPEAWPTVDAVLTGPLTITMADIRATATAPAATAGTRPPTLTREGAHTLV